MHDEPRTPLSQRVDEAVELLGRRTGGFTPRVGLVLGSGLGGFAERFTEQRAVDYAEIPHFPVSAVPGHAGRLVTGRIAGVPSIAMQGRTHYYEGHDLETVTFPVRTMIRLGAETMILTNAAGGIGEGLAVGTLMLLSDHLNLMGANPLRGPHDEELGPRFPDLTRAYSPELRSLAQRAARRIGLTLAEGVYAAVSGPSYETPAEIEMLRRLGANAVGMSTVPEVIVANQMGARVLGVSLITNMAAGRGHEALSHDEVTETAERVKETFAALLEAVLEELGEVTGDAGA